jgi:aryl-alcohol dehydrogenase-like predicted oxidoreductase/predicted kinase/histidinol phosphatase-like enzyme
MRLSTAPDRDDERSVAVLHAAFDEGVRFLDTADAYCVDATEAGHNEGLIARALATWSGDSSSVRVATKGGVVRPDGRWQADGRARALTSACEASLRALGLNRIALYQLHAPDPRVPLATSVRALHALARRGLIDAVGLCNVTVGQIEEARRITEIASVQVELSLWNDASVLGGVVGYCLRHGLPLLAYRPLGGPERRRRVEGDPVLARLAAAHGATAHEIALAALADLSPLVWPIPGPTRVETVQSIARAARISLTDADRAALRARFPTLGSDLEFRSRPGSDLEFPSPGRGDSRSDPRSSRGSDLEFRPQQGSDLELPGRHSRNSRSDPRGEIVLVMGLPGAGKSTVAKQLAADGYSRLNRDEAGGSLAALLPALDRAILAGTSRIVLDNTYVTRKARGAVIQAARRRGLPVRCLWMTTSVEAAQVNAVTRIVSRYGRLLGPDELKSAGRGPRPASREDSDSAPSRTAARGQRTAGTAGGDVSAFPPMVQFRYQRELEPPDASEGFSSIEIITFERKHDPLLVNRAVIVWCDGVLLRSRAGLRVPRNADDVDVAIGRGATLRRYAAEGWKVLGLSWIPEIAAGTMTMVDADAVFARLREALGVSVEVEYCPHPAGPPVCWCRKPLPGLGVVFQQRHRLDPAQCLYVGSSSQDAGFARRMGFEYREAGRFFAAAAADAR